MRVLLPAGLPPDPPAADSPVDLHAHYAEGWLADGGVRVNFVSSVDGAATSAGLSRGLQTPGDNAVFGVLRDLADVILVGAATAAAERYRPANPSARRRGIRARLGLAGAPAIAVMSASLRLDLSAELFSAAVHAPTLVVTGSAAPIGARNDIIDLAGTGPEAVRIIAGEPWPAELTPRLRLAGLLTEDSALFCRYLVNRPEASSEASPGSDQRDLPTGPAGDPSQ